MQSDTAGLKEGTRTKILCSPRTKMNAEVRLQLDTKVVNVLQGNTTITLNYFFYQREIICISTEQKSHLHLTVFTQYHQFYGVMQVCQSCLPLKSQMTPMWACKT